MKVVEFVNIRKLKCDKLHYNNNRHEKIHLLTEKFYLCINLTTIIERNILIACIYSIAKILSVILMKNKRRI